MKTFASLREAKQRLQDPTPLTEDELRAFFPFLDELAGFIGFSSRVHIDVAFQQINAIERFNKASGRLTAYSILASSLQVLVAIVALCIALFRH
jgi:kynureninase